MSVVTDVPEDGEGPGPARYSGRQLRELLADEQWLDELIDRAGQSGVQLTGAGGFLPEMIKAVLERGLDAELTDHLGYERGDPAGRGSPNSRNGSTPKTVATEVGDVAGRAAGPAETFEPRLVPKGERRLGGLDDMIISLYAGGMTVRDIQHHLARTVGTELSHETISKITDAVLEEVKAWQGRPLEAIYPIVYLDALVVKVRDGHQVRNRAAHIAVGVDLDGVKHVLGSGCRPPRARSSGPGLRRAGQPRSARHPDRLLRRADRAAGGDRGHLSRTPRCNLRGAPDPGLDALRLLLRPQEGRRRAAPIYTAPTADAAETALPEFTDSGSASKYPATVASWQNAWERFIPFLAFAPAVRKIIYTTNASSR